MSADFPSFDGTTPQPLSPQFLLVLQDNPETGELDVAGAQRPQQHDDKSPAHIVGRWIHDNLAEIVEVARRSAAPVDQKVITDERHRTIIVDSPAVARVV
jgi:hypothetical protein